MPDIDHDPLHAGRKALDESTRRNEVLRNQLAAIRESGEDSASARHAVLADNETAYELGVFGAERLETDRLGGFAIRARRDALAAKLNSGTTLDKLSAFVPFVRTQITEMKFIGWISIVLLCIILWRVW